VKWIIDEPPELQSKVHQVDGGDPEEDHDRYGFEPLKLIYSRPTLSANVGLHSAHGVASRAGSNYLDWTRGDSYALSWGMLLMTTMMMII